MKRGLPSAPLSGRLKFSATIGNGVRSRHKSAAFDYTEGFDDCQWMYNRGRWKRIIEKPEGWPQPRGLTPRLNREVPRLKAAES